jgi:hypothetical protein
VTEKGSKEQDFRVNAPFATEDAIHEAPRNPLIAIWLVLNHYRSVDIGHGILGKGAAHTPL